MEATETRTARLPHTCDACCGPIQPGNRYERTIGSGEEGFFVLKQHIGICPRDVPAYQAEMLGFVLNDLRNTP